MTYLLPHRFKMIGAIIAPIGFSLWIFMQFGMVTRALNFFIEETSSNHFAFHIVNVCVAILSFFSFLQAFIL